MEHILMPEKRQEKWLKEQRAIKKSGFRTVELNTPCIMRTQREVLEVHRNEEERALCICKHSLTKPWTTANNYSESWECVCARILTAIPDKNKQTLYEAKYMTDPLCLCRLYNLSKQSLSSLCWLCKERSDTFKRYIGSFRLPPGYS